MELELTLSWTPKYFPASCKIISIFYPFTFIPTVNIFTSATGELLLWFPQAVFKLILKHVQNAALNTAAILFGLDDDTFVIKFLNNFYYLSKYRLEYLAQTVSRDSLIHKASTAYLAWFLIAHDYITWWQASLCWIINLQFVMKGKIPI